ncbi:hypothetical protein [Sphaerisporangium perillae]|uniref:hypothetical protein n=1 Tax=Sphaerisporangium perillae TaxID=2935860 RepID=UPI00200F694E|nr:hypothetical protein [Sphaerisporangium perillae]
MRMTAVSAVVGSLGLTGVVLLATAPMTAPRANAAQVSMADPTQVEPVDPSMTDDPGAEPDGPDPTVTVTITESPDPTVTRTKTITPKPTATKAPKPTATKTAPVQPPASVAPPTSAPAIPSNPPILPTTPLPSESPAPDPLVSLALASPTPTPSPSESTEAASSSFDDPTPESVPIEIRNASPEYDQLTLSRKLAIPGVLLAVLVMLGVLIFEGRIRRVAHAAAIRKAGPRSPGRHRGDDVPPGGLPMPGYPIYHGGTAYAPIISFVPVQGYPNVPAPGSSLPPGYGQDPQAYGAAPYDQQGYGASYDQQGYGAQSPQGYGSPHEQGAAGYGYEQGLAGQIALPAEPWTRAEAQEHSGGPSDGGLSDATETFPAVGPRPMPGEPLAGTPVARDPMPGAPSLGEPASGTPVDGAWPGATLQGPLPPAAEDGKPRRGVLGRFRRDPS